ncbi:MAG: hypothetical protein JSW55_01665 [Chloroflexota bacterium]|nr:MAG: hypothetical protein JSW55_01665 [Chloroflexota bacterium]
MFLVRSVFKVKFGHMDKVLAKLQAMAAESSGQTPLDRVLTDVSGSMFTIVFETKTESLDAHRERLMASFDEPEMAGAMAEIGQYFESGHNEYYNIEFEAEG